MKPTAFEYDDPRTADEALALLAQYGDDAKALAGGQSLVPLMNFRLARPGRLVDLNLIAALSHLRVEAGALRIGAMTRQREIERSPLVAAGWPLLAEATALIGHAQIRNRGTVGGSLAHADPAAELPAVMAALDAEFVVRGAGGERTVPATEFFLGYLTTALAPDELLVEIRVPALPPRTGGAFVEVSRRHGDFALVGVAALVTLDADGVISAARLAFTGAAPTPLRAARAEARLVGERPAEPLFREAGLLASADLEPEDDLHASAAYRREVGGVLARRALVQAAARAGRDARG
ncbi:MAG TPA: xanthine dehydrogenase family protein subunit M [Chloroflexota bacterium]|jgi:CO/xanthine dehydrogenase FAD-binding subunit